MSARPRRQTAATGWRELVVPGATAAAAVADAELLCCLAFEPPRKIGSVNTAPGLVSIGGCTYLNRLSALRRCSAAFLRKLLSKH